MKSESAGDIQNGADSRVVYVLNLAAYKFGELFL